MAEHEQLSRGAILELQSQSGFTIYLDKPTELPESHVSHLCSTCRRLNFKHLMLKDSLKITRAAPEEIPLNSLANLLKITTCAFCRLVRQTIETHYGSDKVAVRSKDDLVKLSMIQSPYTADMSITPPNVSQSLVIWIKPNPFEEPTRASPGLYIHMIRKGSLLEGDKMMQVEGIQLTPQPLQPKLIAWVARCSMGIGPCETKSISNTSHQPPEGFRLIDVKERRLVPADKTMSYCTLSYVWGGSKCLKLSRDNEAALGLEGGIDQFKDEIPRTIKDAMTLVAVLDERYLWVDAICIMQDDRKEFETQIKAMNDIYSNSHVTIAAAYGKDAESGLPGVPPNSRPCHRRVEEIQGLSLTSKAIFENCVDNSVWNSRGWTYQERVLSPRILFVTQEQMYFKCQHHEHYMSEDTTGWGYTRKSVTYPMNDTGTDSVPEQGSINFVSYRSIITEYSIRQCSFSRDVLNAFQGIMTKLESVFRCKFLCGLPQTELSSALIWYPKERIVRRKDSETGTDLFPSWSWAGWVGQIGYQSEQSLSRMMWPGDGNATYSAEQLRCPRSQIAYGHDWWRNDWKEEYSNSNDPYYFEKINPTAWFAHPVAPAADRISGPSLLEDTQHLQFWTEAVKVEWAEWVPPKNIPDKEYWLSLDSKTDHASCGGFIVLQTNAFPTLDPANLQYDLIVVSRKHSSVYKDEQKGSRENYDPEQFDGDPDRSAEPNFFPDAPVHDKMRPGVDQQQYDLKKPYCLYNILLVEWHGEVAYRAGYGIAHIDFWACEEPVRKLVTLG